MLSMKSIGAAIFDLDGTVVDSNDVWLSAEKTILERNNIFIPEEILAKLVLLTYEEIYPEMCKFGLTYDFDTFVKIMDEIALSEYENNITLKDDVLTYINLLKNLGIKTAVATSSSRSFAETVLRTNDAYDVFDIILTVEDTGVGKTEPDIYYRAAKELDTPPDRCVVFEDRYNGIVTAKNAGMKTVCVYDRYSQLDFFKARNFADMYIYSFADMLSEKKASLIGDDKE
jgi:HAD superfamily hydrolase (TIGR01509 family)